MITKEHIMNLGLPKILGLVWAAFATIYFFWSVTDMYMSKGKEGQKIAEAQTVGYQTAFVQLGQQLAVQLQNGCKEPVNVNLGGPNPVGLLSADCLGPIIESAVKPQVEQALQAAQAQMAAQQAAMPAPAPAPTEPVAAPAPVPTAPAQ